MRRHHSFIDDLIAFEEYMELRDKKKKDTPKKPEGKSSKLGFFEGLVVAYMAQILYGPLTKLVEIYFATHGVH